MKEKKMKTIGKINILKKKEKLKNKNIKYINLV